MGRYLGRLERDPGALDQCLISSTTTHLRMRARPRNKPSAVPPKRAISRIKRPANRSQTTSSRSLALKNGYWKRAARERRLKSADMGRKLAVRHGLQHDQAAADRRPAPASPRSNGKARARSVTVSWPLPDAGLTAIGSHVWSLVMQRARSHTLVLCVPRARYLACQGARRRSRSPSRRCLGKLSGELRVRLTDRRHSPN
jgi:hypothetical protein